MEEILKQLITPALITALVSGVYGYFQKKKEEYRKYVYENKQKDFQELVKYATELVECGINNQKLDTLLFNISQKINPYGRKIKSFGRYQWIKDDGHIWYQIKKIKKKIDKNKNKGKRQEDLQEDLEELAHRIQVSKRLLDVKLERNVTPIYSVKIWFYFLQYSLLVFQFFLIFSLYKEGKNIFDIFSILLPALIYLLPELSINDSDKRKDDVLLLLYLVFLSAVDAFIVYKLWCNVYRSSFVFMLVLVLIFTLVILKAIIFGESEIGKVSTIYIEEYRELQGPQLSRKRFWEYFPFYKKSKQIENTDA